MLNELIGAVVQVLFFLLIPLAVWYAAARKKELWLQIEHLLSKLSYISYSVIETGGITSCGISSGSSDIDHVV